MSPLLDLAGRVVAGPATARRGAFIVFEGADRAGKSTQCRKLVDRLKASGVSAELWRFPDRTTAIGQMIDSYLSSKTEVNDAAIHLLFSANRWEKRDLLLSKLKAGTTLVVDRYAYSGAVFTAAKKLPGLTLDWCKAADRGLPAPDAVIYLDLAVEAAQGRGGFGDERYETVELQRVVAQKFRELSDGWHLLDASQSVEEIHKAVCNIAMEAIEQAASSGDVATLWPLASPPPSPSLTRPPLSDIST